ncbi:MAG: hypothetical protein KDC98_02140 [Planctomycetes bacterium]|nr:hypothetical protein [Planctomycetota bacterium]
MVRLAALTLATGSLLAIALPGQAAFTPFGTGCVFERQVPAIGNVGLPRLGQTFQITYSGSNYTYNSGQQIAQPHLALGFQSLVTVIPANILIYQPAGCTGYLAPITTIPMAPHPSLPRFEDSYGVSIPNAAGLIGVQLLAQWVMLHTQCGFGGCGYSAIVTSDAATAVIGR